MHFEIRAITSSRQEIVVKKDDETKRVRVVGFDPEATYGQEDLADLARVFAGLAKLLA
jgi:hypothetical protein